MVQPAYPCINWPDDTGGAGTMIEPHFMIMVGLLLLTTLALGARTYKLKFGHRGINHPVKNLVRDKVEVTSPPRWDRQ